MSVSEGLVAAAVLIGVLIIGIAVGQHVHCTSIPFLGTTFCAAH